MLHAPVLEYVATNFVRLVTKPLVDQLTQQGNQVSREPLSVSSKELF